MERYFVVGGYVNGGPVESWAKANNFQAPKEDGLYVDENGTLVQVNTPAPEYQSAYIDAASIKHDGGTLRKITGGVILILGRSGTGKTVLVDHLERTVPLRVIRVGEPGVGRLPLTMASMSYAIADALRERVVCVDSGRMLALTPGSLGTAAGGLPRDMAVTLSLLDYACAHTGTVMFLTFNLLSAKDEALESAYELLEGSVSGVIRVLRVTQKGEKKATIDGDLSLRPDQRNRGGFQLHINFT
jgi:hypothetical protein